MIIKKLKNGLIDVPIVKNIIKRGLYLMKFNGDVIKVGIYGEGCKSNNYTRFMSYRSKGKNIVPGNGSYKTIKILDEKLNVGDEIEVEFIELPADRMIDGYLWKVDLYNEEDKMKEIYKESLWLG